MKGVAASRLLPDGFLSRFGGKAGAALTGWTAKDNRFQAGRFFDLRHTQFMTPKEDMAGGEGFEPSDAFQRLPIFSRVHSASLPPP
jgi:hypothetical protein